MRQAANTAVITERTFIEPIWWGDDGEDEVGAGGVCVGKVQELPDGKELYFFHSEVLSKTKRNLFCM